MMIHNSKITYQEAHVFFFSYKAIYYFRTFIRKTMIKILVCVIHMGAIPIKRLVVYIVCQYPYTVHKNTQISRRLSNDSF